MSCESKGSPASGTKFSQALVNQTPKYDSVKSRKYGIMRPRKKKKVRYF